MKRIIGGLTLALCLLHLHASANTIYLTRHAEKAATGTDPALTPEGQVRATNIAATLKDAQVKHVYSTAYQRTQQTAQPLATYLGLPVKSYDPTQLATFAQQLRALPENVLVVGHSDTTPELIRQLGGDPGSAIAETEFDRLRWQRHHDLAAFPPQPSQPALRGGDAEPGQLDCHHWELAVLHDQCAGMREHAEREHEWRHGRRRPVCPLWRPADRERLHLPPVQDRQCRILPIERSTGRDLAYRHQVVHELQRHHTERHCGAVSAGTRHLLGRLLHRQVFQVGAQHCRSPGPEALAGRFNF
jgi:phosphohistidine phosphatase SixA